jgi:HEPN domain-containing protein
MEIILEDLVRRIQKQADANKIFKKDGEEWFAIAKDDFDVCKVLTEKKHYAGAVYHLQQCYEKLSKSFFILTGTTNPSVVSGHDFEQRRIKEIFKEDWAIASMSLYEFINEKKLEVKEGLMDTISSEEDKIRAASKSEIEKIFSYFKEIENKFYDEKFLDKTEKELKAKRKTLKQIRHYVHLLTRRRIRYSEIVEIITKDRIKKECKNIIMSLKLMLLCILLFPHYNVPRYPKGKKTEINYFSYKSGLGIVDSLDMFITHTEEILRDFEIQFEIK